MFVLNPEEIKKLSLLIKWHRKRCKISQQMLADIANVGRASIQRIEKNQKFEFETLIKVLEALNIKIILDSPLMDIFKKEQ